MQLNHVEYLFDYPIICSNNCMKQRGDFDNSNSSQIHRFFAALQQQWDATVR